MQVLGMAYPYFQIRETDEGNWLRLRLIGELDLGSAPGLKERLGELRVTQRGIRIDLSALDFIDSTGIQVLVWAVREARSNGWSVQIDPNIAPGIENVFRLIHIYDLLVEDHASEAASS